MRLRSASLCVFALLALLVAAPSANAQKNCPGGGSNQPPGNSEVDQYGEDVPGPCGDEPIGPPNGGGDPDAVPPSDAGRARLARRRRRRGGASRASHGARKRRWRQRLRWRRLRAVPVSGASDIPAAQGDSLFDEVFDALTGSADATDDGLGLLLPLILLAALIAAVVYGSAAQDGRRLRTSGGPCAPSPQTTEPQPQGSGCRRGPDGRPRAQPARRLGRCRPRRRPHRLGL